MGRQLKSISGNGKEISYKYNDSGIRTEKTVKYYSVLNKKWVYAEKLLPPMYEQDFFSEIINYAKNKNITVFPTFNSLGHNTLLPKSFPEIASKDENGNSAAADEVKIFRLDLLKISVSVCNKGKALKKALS